MDLVSVLRGYVSLGGLPPCTLYVFYVAMQALGGYHCVRENGEAADGRVTKMRHHLRSSF